jgi:hypothetical protein
MEVVIPPPRTELMGRPVTIATSRPAAPAPKAQPAPKKPLPSAAKAALPKPAAKQVSDSGSGSVEGESTTLNSRMKNYLRMLGSEDRETQSNALKALSKQAADRTSTPVFDTVCL